MNKRIQKILVKFLSLIAGRKKWQSLFETLNHVSLIGIYGFGYDSEISGEKGALEYVSKKLNKEDALIVFDVGANIGNYTLLINKIFQEKASIFSFEPSRLTYQKMIDNTIKIQNLQCFNFGFGDKNTTMKLYSNVAGSTLASLYNRNLEHCDIEMSIEESVEIKTIDTFCFQPRGVKNIHFLKIDVEGHELKVLNGGSEMIKTGNIDYIQFEYSSCNIDSRTYFKDFFLLLKERYHIYRIMRDGLYIINQYKEIYECFRATNFLAERIDLD
jgi:FkbM family methyltransferase